MKLIPPLPGSGSPESEKSVFRKLEALGSFSNNARAYHSLLLPAHSHKRIGEADFVILGPEGLFVLEVKSIGSCRDGLWDYGYRDGIAKAESPAAQARSALFAILDYLEKESGVRDLKQKIVYGYGVIFTACDLSPTIEMPPEILLTRYTLHLFDQWMHGLKDYWRLQKHGQQQLRSGDIEKLHSCLRRNYEVPLKDILKGLEDRACEFTESQFVFIDTIAANPRVLCSGGAGTGKTFLAEELAIRRSREGANVLLLCKSPWLASFLASRITHPKVLVSSVGQLAQKVAFAGLSLFDTLIIDEGQDLMSFEALETMEIHLRDGLEKGNWCIFHDANNQTGFWSDFQKEAFDYLRSLLPATVLLKKNCRNTKEILLAIQQKTGCDVGVDGVGSGPAVELRFFGGERSEASALVEVMKELRNEGLKGETVILSAAALGSSCIQRLNGKARSHITVIDKFAPSSLWGDNFRLCQIKDFKGLEAEVVVLIDLPQEAFDMGSDSLAQTYIGMSRARSKLYVMCAETLSV